MFRMVIGWLQFVAASFDSSPPEHYMMPLKISWIGNELGIYFMLTAGVYKALVRGWQGCAASSIWRTVMLNTVPARCSGAVW